MAQSGFTPILIYSSTTVSQAPSASNLTNSTLGSELAINITDGKLFYKDNSNAVQVIGWKTVPATAGGTGITGYMTGDILYASSGTALARLADVATGNALISGGIGAAPSYGKIGLTTHISGTLAVANGGTGITTTPTNGQIPIGNGTNYTAATLTAGYGISVTNGAGSVTVATSIGAPQVTTYTSGSGTYTVPANAKYLQVVMVGGGGGGAGSDATGGTGGSGGNTTFGTATAGGGSGGATNASNGGSGGTATLGAISGIGVTGGVGDGGITGGTYPKGGMGGSSGLGGAGSGSGGSTAAAGGNAKANTGGGGGGASCVTASTFSGSGGGAGAYINGVITSPGASYSYAVGAGGTAGAAGTVGFAGAGCMKRAPMGASAMHCNQAGPGMRSLLSHSLLPRSGFGVRRLDCAFIGLRLTRKSGVKPPHSKKLRFAE